MFQISHSFPFGHACKSPLISSCQESGRDSEFCQHIGNNYNLVVDTFRSALIHNLESRNLEVLVVTHSNPTQREIFSLIGIGCSSDLKLAGKHMHKIGLCHSF